MKRLDLERKLRIEVSTGTELKMKAEFWPIPYRKHETTKDVEGWWAISCYCKKVLFSDREICVIGNHFHIIVQPLNGESLSAIMQWIMIVFANARIHHSTGLSGAVGSFHA